MPQPLRVDTDQLRLSAGRLDAVNAETSAQLTTNMGAMAACHGGWMGTTMSAFEQLRDTWELADASRADRLGDISRNLFRSAALYEQRDHASAENIDQSL